MDLNNWADGTRLVIPSEVLVDREAFPPNELVRIRVNADFGDEIGELVADLGVEFAPSAVKMVVDSSFRSIIDQDDVLVIDFGGSYTLDGIELGDDEWIWEWDWNCVIPEEIGKQSRECVYEDGGVVAMPGESQSKFEGEEGKRFEKGVPLFFSVKSRVRAGGVGGKVVAEGRWSSIVNPVGEEALGLELIEDFWVCSDSSVGFSVLFFLFFLSFSCVFGFCGVLFTFFFVFISFLYFVLFGVLISHNIIDIHFAIISDKTSF